MWIFRIIVSVIFAIAFGMTNARAEVVRTSVGVTLDALSGKHETGTGAEHLNFVPIPVFEFEARYKRSALRIETIPSIPFSYGPAGDQSTRLGLLILSLRRNVGKATFAGIGETMYNQRTTYPITFNPDGSREQYSRVVGMRYELGRDLQIRSGETLELRVSANPIMHGVQYTRLLRGYGCPRRPPGTGACVPLFGESRVEERAAQVDLGAQVVHGLAHADVLLGIRYLNYSARYVIGNRFYDNGRLADRNVGLLPLVGYRLRF